ncbi:MAG TPA: DUF2163 domain-containing protein [Croceibacterium sp.]|nr:DUF2163 domain-containing protein [Croceibacterium sp.]
MSRVFNREPLEGLATFWRVQRRDGVTLGFTGHDRDLWFDGLLHRSAPGMVPSAVRRSADLSSDSAEVEGALTHDGIAAPDLAQGRFDGAGVTIGVIDWESLEREVLYRGEIGEVSEEAGSFNAELRSAKTRLELDPVPRTSPTCRARFCGPGCTLSAARFTHEAVVETMDSAANRVTFTGGPPATAMAGGEVRWIDDPQAGTTMRVNRADGGGLSLGFPLHAALEPGTRAVLREGCDHTLQTCRVRFANAVNFQGEPFVPGNDLLARYPTRAA